MALVREAKWPSRTKDQDNQGSAVRASGVLQLLHNVGTPSPWIYTQRKSAKYTLQAVIHDI